MSNAPRPIPDYMYRRKAREYGYSSWDDVPAYLKRRTVRYLQYGHEDKTPRVQTGGRSSSLDAPPGTLSARSSKPSVSQAPTVQRRTEEEVRAETPRYGLPNQKPYIPPSSSVPYGLGPTSQDTRSPQRRAIDILTGNTTQESAISFNQTTRTRLSPGYYELLQRTKRERQKIRYEEARTTGASITPGLTSTPEYAQRPAYKNWGLPDYITQDIDRIKPYYDKVKSFETKYISPPLKETVIPHAQTAISYGTGLNLLTRGKKALFPEQKQPEWVRQGEQVISGFKEGMAEYASKPITQVAPDYLTGRVFGAGTRIAVKGAKLIPGVKRITKAATKTPTRKLLTNVGITGIFAGGAVMSEAPRIIMQPTLQQAGRQAGKSTSRLAVETVGFMRGYETRPGFKPSPTRTGTKIGLRYGEPKIQEPKAKIGKNPLIDITRTPEIPPGSIGVPQETIVRSGSGRKLLRYKTTKPVDVTKGQYARSMDDIAILTRPSASIVKITQSRTKLDLSYGILKPTHETYTTRKLVYSTKPYLTIRRQGYQVYTPKPRKPGRIKTRITRRTPYVEILFSGPGLPKPKWDVVKTTTEPIPISIFTSPFPARRIGYTPKLKSATINRVPYTTKPVSYTPPKPQDLEGIVIIQRRPGRRTRTITQPESKAGMMTTDGQILIQEPKIKQPKQKRIIDFDELFAKEQATLRRQRATAKQRLPSKPKQPALKSRSELRIGARSAEMERLRAVSIGARSASEARLKSLMEGRLKTSQHSRLDLKQDQDLKLISTPKLDLKLDQDLIRRPKQALRPLQDLRTPTTPRLQLRLETPPPPPPIKLGWPSQGGAGRKIFKKKKKRKTSAIYSPSFTGIWGNLPSISPTKTIKPGAGLFARPTVKKKTKRGKK